MVPTVHGATVVADRGKPRGWATRSEAAEALMARYPSQPDGRIQEKLDDRDVPIICIGADDASSHRLADWLEEVGYRYVFTFRRRSPRF